MRVWVLSAALAVTILGCAQPQPAGPVFPPIPYFMYTVRHEAEPLALIAKWYTGASENGRALITHNPQLNPTAALAVGDIIRIPEMMLITRKAIPEEVFAKLKNRVAKPAGAQAVKQPTVKPEAKAAAKTSATVAAATPVQKEKSTPTQQSSPKLETFDDKNDEVTMAPAPTSVPMVVTASAPVAEKSVAVAVAPTIALEPEELKIYENSVQPMKPTAVKSTYEQMQEILGK